MAVVLDNTPLFLILILMLVLVLLLLRFCSEPLFPLCSVALTPGGAAGQAEGAKGIKAAKVVAVEAIIGPAILLAAFR